MKKNGVKLTLLRGNSVKVTIQKKKRNTNTTTQTRSIHLPTFLYIYIPHPSQSYSRPYDHQSTQQPLPFLLLPVSGLLMPVLQ